MTRRHKDTKTSISELEAIIYGDVLAMQESNWELFQPTRAWLKEFINALFITRQGAELWKRLLDGGGNPVQILEWIALGVGSFATLEELAEIVDYVDEGLDDEGNRIVGEPIFFDGSFGTETEFSKGLSQARLMRPFLTRCLDKVSVMNSQLEAIKMKRDGPVFVPSFEWPELMTEYDTSLKLMIRQLESLVSHYKSISHASRKSKNHNGILTAVDTLRNQLKCDNAEVLLLLNAGYLASGKAEMSEAQLRDSVKSARQVFEYGDR